MNNIDYDKRLADLKAQCSRYLNTAYNRGYYDGTQSNEDELENEYEKGLNDAWECARKINAISFWKLEDIFKCNPNDIYKMSASEAIAKIKEYEEEQKQTDDELKVGDEVILPQKIKSIVTNVSNESNTVVCLYGDGSDCTFVSCNLSTLTKTGRHFPQIAEVLKQMKEEQ